MKEQNLFHGAGLKTMERTGLTQEEQSLSRDENMTFNEKVEKLRTGAELIANTTKFGIAIQTYSRLHGGATNLTEEDCEHFLLENPDCPYEAGMILAVAEKLEATRGPKTLH